jgi:hypothetical protein
MRTKFSKQTKREARGMDRFDQHREAFMRRRRVAGFLRWMAGRFGQPSTADKPDKPPVWLRERN